MMIFDHPLLWWIVLSFVVGLVAFVVWSVGYLCALRHSDRIRSQYRTQGRRPGPREPQR